MYLERLWLNDARHSGGGDLDVTAGPGRLRQWNLLPAGGSSSVILRGLALAGLGGRQMEMFVPLLGRRVGQPVYVECVQVRHAPQERMASRPVRWHLGWRARAAGGFEAVPRSLLRQRDVAAPPGAADSGRSLVGWLLLGYGPHPEACAGTDGFDIPPDQRLKRCAGLFGGERWMTDPVAFLRRVHHKARFRNGRMRALLARLGPDLSHWLGWEVETHLATAGRLEARWQATPRSWRITATVALDMVRHVFDASARLQVSDPLQQPGVVLFDRPEAWCEAGHRSAFFQLLAGWFPNLQFFVALSPSGRRRFPACLRRRSLAVPVPEPRIRPVPPRRLPRGTVVLVDVDGTLPNLALMKLSRHWKAEGRRVALVRGVKALPGAGDVLASCVFRSASSARRLDTLRRRYGDTLQLGGSGVDLVTRLAPDVEGRAPDYALYPELGDRALGFLTRGCPRRCPFCVVPAKEGAPRRVSDFEPLLQGRRKLILLDDNLLAHPSALELLEGMVRRDLAVNFNQTLDLHRLTAESAGLLRRIRCANAAFTRRNYHFSLNDACQLERVRQRYQLLQVTGRDNVEFVCMYGFNTRLSEDVARFRFLRSLPGAYVFVQRYQQVPGGPAPDLSRFFDGPTDALLDELVRIVFKQNMKSMETYYRWVALQYAAQCRRVHRGLVETLFRYNGRAQMGGFLHRLESLCRGRAGPGGSASLAFPLPMSPAFA